MLWYGSTLVWCTADLLILSVTVNMGNNHEVDASLAGIPQRRSENQMQMWLPIASNRHTIPMMDLLITSVHS